jgi:hypothetical protein
VRVSTENDISRRERKKKKKKKAIYDGKCGPRNEVERERESKVRIKIEMKRRRAKKGRKPHQEIETQKKINENQNGIHTDAVAPHVQPLKFCELDQLLGGF